MGKVRTVDILRWKRARGCEDNGRYGMGRRGAGPLGLQADTQV